MNISFLTRRIVLLVALFGQFSFGMENQLQLQKNNTFIYFSELLPEMQQNIFTHSNNKSNIQATNKYWSKTQSIQSPTVFVNGCCGIDNQHMIRVVLNAAYMKNYKGVENILKNSNLLQNTKNNIVCYCTGIHDDNEVILDLYSLVHYCKDDTMMQLLQSYTINQCASKQQKSIPSSLLMACLAGSSHLVREHLYYDREYKNNAIESRGKALAVAIDCDHGECVKLLLNDVCDDSNFTDIIVNYGDTQWLINKKFLRYACVKKKLKALKELLAINYFDLNEGRIFCCDDSDDCTKYMVLLDKVLELAQKDPEYTAVASLLEKYGAKTAIDIINNTEEEQEIATRSFDCIIS